MRMNAPKELFNNNSLVKLKDQNWLNKQRVAGKIASGALKLLENLVKNKTFHSMAALNDIAEDYIIKNGGTCTFKNYKGFPAGCCISINKELVHGIPKDIVLNDGDLVSFDLGVTYEGAIADTAITCIFGTPKSEQHVQLVKATKEALMKGIESVHVGDRIGVIGKAISKCAKNYGFGVINNYGGHGISWNTPHAAPFIENKSDETKGIRIQPGLTIAIEPMLVIGSTNTTTLNDKWTVITPDIGAHEEHTIFVHNDHVEIITNRDYNE